MEVVEKDSRRSLIRAFFASVAAAGAGVFGVAQAQADALEMAGKAARVEFFGGLPKTKPTATLNTNLIHYKELLISGSYSEKRADFESAMGIVFSGRFPAADLVTTKLPLARICEAFPLMEQGSALKVSIAP